MRKLFPLILIMCTVGAWSSILYRNVSMPKAYDSILVSANTACEQGYYLEAQAQLDQAQALREQNSYEMDVLQRDIYHGLQNGNAYEKQLQSMIMKYPDVEDSYEKLITYYQDTEDTNALCKYLPQYLERWSENETMITVDKELDRQYEYVKTGYYDVKYASASLADIQTNQYETVGDKGVVMRKLVNGNGITVFDAGYAQISVAQDGNSCFVCDQDGIWTRIDINQNLLARNQEVSFDYVGRLADNNMATAVINDQYQFINEKMKISDIKWEDAGTFHNNLNAVKRNGCWALVTTDSWLEVTEFPYTDIPRNSQDYCTTDGYAVVSDKQGYYVIDAVSLLPVSDHVYEEMKAFESSQPTAYRKDNKWGFVNKQGEVYLEAVYEDARPFVNGYAAVKLNGLWGYIDRNGTMVIDAQFQDALNVLNNGYAYVKNEFGYWDYIVIAKLYYTDRG